MFADPTDLRLKFSHALSEMYRNEVPAYGTLLDVVAEINGDDAATRLAEERHGAIRVGTARELNLVGRVFAQLGLEPVGYYDLGVAGLPVHSTAFRPVTEDGLERCPFRVFTSLLRLDAITDVGLRETAEATLASRDILTPEAHAQLEKAEAAGGVAEEDADDFIAAILDIFRWHDTARVSSTTYKELLSISGLIADIVSFKGPHINHLTPRVTDIDRAHKAMAEHGLATKETIEGPPARDCPLLLRQTAFKALTEDVTFTDGVQGGHTARFGEIEQRGAALTRKGMTLYEGALASGDFTTLPDNWSELIAGDLIYHKDGEPLTYEDFLPVSAAGIFRSNLDKESGEGGVSAGNQAEFEAALGRNIVSRFGWYEGLAS
jgi:uncharacterized glyoxalase superfamily metalloenzyme YdcJ